MKRTYFTLRQARHMLPEVKKHLAKINKLHQRLCMLDSFDMEHEDPEMDEKIQRFMEKEFHYVSYLFYKELENLDKKGVMVRDLNQGLIDFRSLFQGKEIFLCWHYGEPTIQFWHGGEDGFQGRKLITELREDKFHGKQNALRRPEKKREKKMQKQLINSLKNKWEN